jgi:thiol-disulfide isomerase/thioredoxin
MAFSPVLSTLSRPSSIVAYVALIAVLLPWPVQASATAHALEAPTTGNGDSVAWPDGMCRHPSVGKPAPAATIHPLNGDAVDLSSLHGKVVVLDFWASWCRPCAKSLPHLADLAREFAGRDAVIYAVDQWDSAAEIESFMLESDLEIPAALDREGAASVAFGVSGIPHLVVIDQTGTIRAVSIGYDPDSAEVVKRRIEQLLDGGL